jgi:hypothetical protein
MVKKATPPKSKISTKDKSDTEKELTKEIQKAKDSIDKIKNSNITAPQEEDENMIDREKIIADYGVTDRQLNFVIEYMHCNNKLQAYRLAYPWSTDWACARWSRVLTTKNVNVMRLINDWKMERFNNALSVVKFEKDTVLKSLGYAMEVILKELDKELISEKDKLGYLRELNNVTKEMSKIQWMYPKEIPELPNRSDDEINNRLNLYTADYVRNLLNNWQTWVQIKQTTMTILPQSPQQTE